MKIIMIIKIMITIIKNNNLLTIIIITTMELPFNHGYHWRNGCPELNYVYPLWVNICVENAIKPQNNVPVWYVVRNQNSVERIRVTAIQVLSSKRVQLSYVSF